MIRITRGELLASLGEVEIQWPVAYEAVVTGPEVFRLREAIETYLTAVGNAIEWSACWDHASGHAFDRDAPRKP